LGIVNALPGFMAANVLGVIASIAGWFVAELVANSHHYSRKRDLVLAYITGSTLHFLGFSMPMYLSTVEYMTSRQEVLHLTDAALHEYLQFFTWPIYIGMAGLTVLASFLGAWMGIKLLKKHFKKAGLVN
jgi:energy-coupling factor transport system substrate-specific component